MRVCGGELSHASRPSSRGAFAAALLWAVFVGSDDTAPVTCTFVSLIASSQLHGLDPEAHLRDLFRILPSWPRHRVLELAPKYWAATRTRLDLAQLEIPFGPVTIPPPLPASQP